jgi:penicillin-binding protein 1C
MKQSLLIIMATLVVAIFVYAIVPKPEIKSFTSYSNVFLDDDDSLLRITLAEDDRYRVFESLDHISPNLISATILYEDQDYFKHTGVDYLALLRAFWTTYIKQDRRVGASTIAMQVARLRWSIPSHTLNGKIQQIFRAIQLTRHYSKEKILEVYLNIVPYGRNIEGIAAASLIYFNKKPDQLTLPEALSLAVIPQNPNKRNPTTVEGVKHLSVARDNLLNRWIESFPEDTGKKIYFELALNFRAPESLPFHAPHFVDYINKLQPRWENGSIHTTLHSRHQNLLERIVKNYISSKKHIGINNAAALLIDHKTMELKAMVGSVDFYNDKLHGQVNGVLAKRSPGSTLKPFVYALAIDEGLIHPMTLMKDAQRRFAGFTPENYDKRFLGPILVKDALIQSRNVPAVELQSRLKKKSFYSFLKQAGIADLKEESFYGLALALGGGEVTMLELVKLYAVLANNGRFQEVKMIQKTKNTTSKQLISAESAFLVLDMLKDNPRPDDLGFDAGLAMKNDVAWKTGTSWAFRDAWAVGISGRYIIAVWVGNFDGKGNDAFIGRSAAGPLLFSIFDAIFPEQGWTVNNLIASENLNIKKVKVCSNTGDLFGKYCPVSAESWFIPGVSPINVSRIYQAIPIENSTGLRACWHQPGKTQMKVFEFWSSDFLHVFSQAGISLKTPPKFSTSCSLDQKSSFGQVPVIRSPQRSLQYVIRNNDKASQKIPFSAVVDPDVDLLYWFVSGKYVGESARGEKFMWVASSGDYDVRVVDDAGRAASVALKVLQVQ